MNEVSLPRGWVSLSVADVGISVTGNTPSTKDKTNYGFHLPYIKPPQLNDCLISSSEEYLSKKGASLARVLPPGSVLVSCIGNLGRTALNTVPLAFNQQINAIILREGIDPKFIFYQAQSHEFRGQLEAKATATTISIVNKGNFENIKLNLAPVGEQRRIVAKIETLFSELDKGIESLKTAREQLKVYRQAVLKYSFEGKLTAQWREENKEELESPEQLLVRIQQEREARYQQQLKDWVAAVKVWEKSGKQGKRPGKPSKPELVKQSFDVELPELPDSWMWLEYRGVCERIRNGISAKPEGDDGAKVFRISAVRAMEFVMDDIRHLDNSDGKFDEYFLAPGDLVFTRYNGSRAYVGVCAEYKGDGTHLYPDKLIQTRLGVASINTSFLEKAINCGESRRFLESRIRTTAGQSGVSGGDIKAMPVPICGLEEQKIIELYLADTLSKVDAMTAEIGAGLMRAETLRQSILKKAFVGQLVPQDPRDEPASVLLERIRAERPGAANASRSHRVDPARSKQQRPVEKTG